jgi:inner membrane protein
MQGRDMKRSAGIRLAIIVGVSLVLLIPAQMIQGLIRERERTRDGAIAEVSGKWGRGQTLAGPILTVPYNEYTRNKKGKVLSATVRHAHFLPEKLSVTGTVRPEVRYRGIFEVMLYNGKLRMTGEFAPPKGKDLSIDPGDFLWNEAFLSLGISDLKGLKEIVRFQWGDKKVTAHPGIPSKDILSSGVSARVPLRGKRKTYPFSLELDLNGSRNLFFVPVGKETRVTLTSPWPSPSFQGEFLPESRSITAEGFSAGWKVLSLNRNFPQQWTGRNDQIATSAFGVDLLLPVDEYQKTMRTAKYALLFIALTFAAFFLLEVLSDRSIHPIQYLLVGLALVLFYSLLLSFTEHLRFPTSYFLAGAGIVGTIAAYSAAVLKSRALASIVAGIVTVLYGFLYILLQLEDYALLLGSLGLFVILGLFMYLTRRVDWFTVLRTPARAATS